MKIRCPLCADDYAHDIEGTITHDPGCWRTKNGDGWPESWELDFDASNCPTFDDSPAHVEAMDRAFSEESARLASGDDYDGPDTVRERDE